MDEYIKRKDEAPRVIYLQWKDDFGEVLGETTWCFERIYIHDIRYIIDKRHLTSHSSRAADAGAKCVCYGTEGYYHYSKCPKVN